MLVQTRKQFEAARTILLDADIISLDSETTGLSVWRGHRYAGFSVYTELKGRDMTIGYYFPLRHQEGDNLLDSTVNIPSEWVQELSPVFEDPEKTWLFHNARFDMGMFRAENIHIKGPFYDTMLMSYLCEDENKPRKLEYLYDELFKTNTIELSNQIKAMARKAGKGTARYDMLNPGVIEPYAVQDVRSCWRLFWHYKEKMVEEEQWDLWPDEQDFCLLLHEMEWYGCKVNLDFAAKLSMIAKQEMRTLEDKLGFDPLKLDVLAQKIHYPPPDGLGIPIGILTNDKSKIWPKGRPMMDKKILKTYKNELTENVLRYRELVKANSTWYEGFLQRADKNGRLHADWRQHGTKTTRLSCSTPNLQQLPRDIEKKPVRKLLVPPEGFELWEFDYNQIELRLGAIYAQEEEMMNAFRRGEDAHQLTADRLSIERYMGKTINFLIIYGGGQVRLADQLGIDEALAKEYLDGFHEQFPGFRRTAHKALEAAKVRGWVRLWTGHRRYISRPEDYHKAFNRLVQGGAAQIVQRTMLMFHREPDWENRRLVAQIHDALIFEVNSEWANKGLNAQIQRMMEWPTEKFPLPFPVEMKLVNKAA